MTIGDYFITIDDPNRIRRACTTTTTIITTTTAAAAAATTTRVSIGGMGSLSLFFFFSLRGLSTPRRSPSRSPSLSPSLSHSIYQGPKGPFLLPISFLLSFLSHRVSTPFFHSLHSLSTPRVTLSPCSRYSRVKHGREGDETTDTRTRTPLAQASTFDPAPDMRR